MNGPRLTRRWLAAGALALLVVVVAAFWFVFFRGDTPAPVSIGAGLEQLQEDLASERDTTPDPPPSRDDADSGSEPDSEPDSGPDPGADSGSEPDPGPDPGPPTGGAADGTWIVDDEFGEFDFDTASGSFAGFRVDEELTVGEVTAVGRTGGVTGSLIIDDSTLVAAEITVDMTTIESNDFRRENAIRGAVRASVYPTATFVLTEPVQLDVDALESGATHEVEAVGDLTVNGTANQVSFHLHPTIVEPGLGLIVGHTEIFWSDFGVTAPRAPIVVSVADHGIVEFQLLVRRQ
ncbi:MAG: YceI family protein [Acidimicrobiaceae bacterium]|nr:YceI family protein [Acidimicrobiia bacterium]MCY4495305.1 YceI family protein [Acidimicrobiaceae bacterium]